jgi:flavin reductase (DIM6/NTAB) family NADH-FMN oxidoreductase RutF
MAFDERQFRDALGRFATGVAVVTSQIDGVKIAMTVSSFNAVSLRPPLVLFSIGRNAQSFDLWQRAKTFAVMVLQEGQGALSSKFAMAGGKKWHDLVVVPGRTGVPLLPSWLACFECNVYARYDGGRPRDRGRSSRRSATRFEAIVGAFGFLRRPLSSAAGG